MAQIFGMPVSFFKNMTAEQIMEFVNAGVAVALPYNNQFVPFRIQESIDKTPHYFIGGTADRQSHEVCDRVAHFDVTKYPPMPASPLSGPEYLISTTRATTRYSRRVWFMGPECPLFIYFAPMDWAETKVVDHITGGGKDGSTWKAIAKARGRSYAPTDPNAQWRAFTAARAYHAGSDPVAIEDAGVRAGEIVGWRVWELRGEKAGPYLQSTHQTHRWRPGEPMVGDVSGAYGVHAWAHPLDALAYMLGIAEAVDLIAPPLGYVLGTVDLYGAVIEHEVGYRARFAMVNNLVSVHPPARPVDYRSVGMTQDEALAIMLDELRRRHGCGT